MRTIDRAEQVVVNNGGKRRDVDIRIVRGTYYKQTADWTTNSPGNRIRFIPASYRGEPVPPPQRPTFNGLGQRKGFWLNIDVRSDTRFTVAYMKVRRYTNGLRISGGYDYDDGPHAVAHGIRPPLRYGRVFGMAFGRIGAKYGPGIGYAAVQVQDTRWMSIARNTFRRIENGSASTNSLVHAVYAVASKGLTVRRNTMYRISGDAIRVRHATSGRFARNSVDRAGRYAAISDWYCTSACAWENDQSRELPSTDLEFYRNRVGDSYYGHSLPLFRRTV